MTTFRIGGQRRIDRLLAPGFVEQAVTADDDTLLRHRADAVQEDADLSYVRRLLQGRIDLLRYEQERRAGGGEPLRAGQDDAALARTLAKVLANPASDSWPGSAPAPGEPAPSAEARRSAEAAVADLRVSDAATLDDDALAEAVSRLRDLEAGVSRSRLQVQEVVDRLSAEVAYRVESGVLSADRILPG